ncbi:MAG: type II toxin-antitoxin system VapC family toxin [Bacteroidaceae bacterium]|nr:type II toxin-antitoxin system VapC family toxin [Bacteroidaceae bacterium]
MRYLLDTHAAVWLLTKDSRLPRHLLESALYCEDDFSVSEATLIEILQLQQGGRIDTLHRPATVRKTLADDWNVNILPISTDILELLYDIPVPETPKGRHSDPFDRIIIATAIKRGMTLVSADTKFPWYEEHCQLHLMQI